MMGVAWLNGIWVQGKNEEEIKKDLKKKLQLLINEDSFQFELESDMEGETV